MSLRGIQTQDLGCRGKTLSSAFLITMMPIVILLVAGPIDVVFSLPGVDAEALLAFFPFVFVTTTLCLWMIFVPLHLALAWLGIRSLFAYAGLGGGAALIFFVVPLGSTTRMLLQESGWNLGIPVAAILMSIVGWWLYYRSGADVGEVVANEYTDA